MTTKRTLQSRLPLGYQSGAWNLEARRGEFRALIQGIAHSLRSYCRNSREGQRVDDIIRGRSLSIDGLELLCELAARSETPSVMEEAVRGAVVQRVANPLPLCVHEASESETNANGPLDLAQLLFAKDRSPVRLVQVKETAIQQAYATRQLIDAVNFRLAREA